MAKNITSVYWEADALPDGMSINSDNGEVTGTPNVEPGTYTAYATVTTNYGTDTKPITVVVAIPDAWLPVIDPDQVINVVADEEMEPYTVTGTNVTKD